MSVRWSKTLDEDLRSVFEWIPEGNGTQYVQVERVAVPIEYAITERELAIYGPRPWTFRPVKQSGSRVHLRLHRDGADVRFGADDPYEPGEWIERRAYSRELRSGRFWRRLDGESNE